MFNSHVSFHLLLYRRTLQRRPKQALRWMLRSLQAEKRNKDLAFVLAFISHKQHTHEGHREQWRKEKTIKDTEGKWNKLVFRVFFFSPLQTCRCIDSIHWGHQGASNSVSTTQLPAKPVVTTCQDWSQATTGEEFHSIFWSPIYYL